MRSKVSKLDFDFSFGQIHGIPIMTVTVVSEVLLTSFGVSIKQSTKNLKIRKKEKPRKVIMQHLKSFFSVIYVP